MYSQRVHKVNSDYKLDEDNDQENLQQQVQEFINQQEDDDNEGLLQKGKQNGQINMKKQQQQQQEQLQSPKRHNQLPSLKTHHNHNKSQDEENQKSDQISKKGLNLNKNNSSNQNQDDEYDQIEVEEESKHEQPKKIATNNYDFNNQKSQKMFIVGGNNSNQGIPLQQAYKNHLQHEVEAFSSGKNVKSNLHNNLSSGNVNQENNKFSEFLLAEKQRKFVRLPRLYGKRKAMTFKCPHCKSSDKELRTKIKHECTGNQWCACIVLCFFGCYPICCVPFCFKRCYNVKHLCPQCLYQVGESGI